MANEIRVRGNITSGTLSVALSNVDTTMNSAGLANLPAVTSAGHAVIVIENEIIYVTAHTAAATSATILRAQEGTSAAAHNNGTAWLHGPVVSDFDSVLAYAQVVANQTGITTEASLTGLSVTVTVPYAQHRIRIIGEIGLQRSVADGISRLSIKESATVLQFRDGFVRGAAEGAVTLHAEAIIVPTAASHTYNLTLTNTTGTGNSSVIASSTNPSFISVEDLGPAL